MIGVATWHEGRCGSSVLGALLNQHSQIQAANEIFSRYMPRRWGDKPVPAIPEVLQQTVAQACKPLLQIEIKSLRAQNRSLYPELTLEHWFHQLLAHGFRRQVILHRRNGLRRLVSHLMAQSSGVFVQSAAEPLAQRPALFIDTTAIQEGAETHDLLHWLDLYATTHQQLVEAIERFCASQALPAPLQLVYEESLEADPQVAYRQLCAWLELEPEPVTLLHRRINPEPLPQLIANWEEICGLVEPTPYAWMLAA